MTKNKTTVKPLSNHLFVYTKQPTTKNTKPGDVVLYKKDLWLNDGNNVIPMSLTKNYVDEKVEEALKENTMENYIVINGKKAELTEEQLKQLGIKTKKESEKKRTNPFDSTPRQVHVYSIGHVGVQTFGSILTPVDLSMTESLVNTANSFNDYDFARQLYLHELLNRKLLKYAYDNEAEDVKWDCNSKQHYYIFFDYSDKVFSIATGISIYKNEGSVYFSKQEVAENAIEDIVKPFMEEHPEFIW